MKILLDLLKTLYEGTSSSGKLPTILVLALLGSVCCFVFCTYYSKLWNRDFRVSAQHKILSFIAAVISFTFIFLFIAFADFKKIAELNISNWSETLVADQAWEMEASKIACNEMRELDLSDCVPPDDPNEGVTIRLTKPESMVHFANFFSSRAKSNFQQLNPFLSLCLQTNIDIPVIRIQQSIREFFTANPNSVYPIEKAIELAATLIQEDLERQAPRVVIISRSVLVALFLLVQGIPFFIIGYAAYKNLKIG